MFIYLFQRRSQWFESRSGHGCLSVVLSSVGRGLCDGLITRPEESYRVSNCMCVIKETPKGAVCSSREPTGKWMNELFISADCVKIHNYEYNIHSLVVWNCSVHLLFRALACHWFAVSGISNNRLHKCPDWWYRRIALDQNVNNAFRTERDTSKPMCFLGH
jgi:hypothetical protein